MIRRDLLRFVRLSHAAFGWFLFVTAGSVALTCGTASAQLVFLPPPSAEADAGANYQNNSDAPPEAQVVGNVFVEQSASSPFPPGFEVVGSGFASAIAQSHSNLSLHSLSRTHTVLNFNANESVGVSSFGRAENISQWIATGPAGTTDFQLDFRMQLDGVLNVAATGLENATTTGPLTAGVVAEARLLRGFPNPPLSLFSASAGIDSGVGFLPGTTTPNLNATLLTQGLWTMSDFVLDDPLLNFGPGDGAASGVSGLRAILNYDREFENIATLPIGTPFDIQMSLTNSTTGVLGLTGSAWSDFFNSGSFVLSTSTPGVTIQQVGGPGAAIPEPGTFALLLAVMIPWLLRRGGRPSWITG